ncbi:TetR/AcrR family transcriptional regulator [Rhodovulum adriaticum]|nr:TetR/AcrR family transcriptional regulator [Rhodovulum adriaticum]
MSPAERGALILDAAEQVLLDGGLHALTMEGVAQAAGMSKRTLYCHFSGRDALMSALVTRLREAVIKPLNAEQIALPLERRLHLLLDPQAENQARATALEILRAVVAEAPQHPDLARRFLQDGPRAVRGLIHQELDRGVARGEIALRDTGTAADLLHAMALPCPLEAFLNPGEGQSDAATRSAHVNRAIAVFLHGARLL